MTKIYRGTVQNVTVDILTAHLLRDWLRVPEAGSADGIRWGEWPATLRSIPRKRPDGKVLDGERVPRENLDVELNRDPYYATLTLKSNAGELGWVELTQWRTNEVEVFVFDWLQDEGAPDLWPAGTICADLGNWLEQHYKNELQGKLLTKRQQEKWEVLREFTALVEGTGRAIQDVEQDAPYNLEKGGMRKRWTRLRDEIGFDPPWPR